MYTIQLQVDSAFGWNYSVFDSSAAGGASGAGSSDFGSSATGAGAFGASSSTSHRGTLDLEASAAIFSQLEQLWLETEQRYDYGAGVIYGQSHSQP